MNIQNNRFSYNQSFGAVKFSNNGKSTLGMMLNPNNFQTAPDIIKEQNDNFAADIVIRGDGSMAVIDKINTDFNGDPLVYYPTGKVIQTKKSSMLTDFKEIELSKNSSYPHERGEYFTKGGLYDLGLQSQKHGFFKKITESKIFERKSPNSYITVTPLDTYKTVNELTPDADNDVLVKRFNRCLDIATDLWNRAMDKIVIDKDPECIDAFVKNITK